MKHKRNEPCACGSGKKYKQCHAKLNNRQNNQFLVIGLIAVVAIIIFFIDTNQSYSNRDQILQGSLNNQFTTARKSQPESDPPPGKVWSVEHGHWHDAPSSNNLDQISRIKPTTNNSQNKKYDKNNPPPGKVWNEQHGHFHDQ